MTHLPHDLKPITDLGMTLGKNLSDGLIKPMQKLAKSVIETNNKMRELKPIIRE